ncbi:MAG TPA: hypothetical protein GX503_05130 [Clostridiales bacterium]|nr:hypothetical protein [Clostridiales bacterium]
MEKYQIILLNEIICKIYQMQNFDEMRYTILKILKTLVPFKIGTFYLASKENNHLLSNPVGIGLNKEKMLEFINTFEDKDYTVWVYSSGKTMVYSETELFPDQFRKQTAYYQELYKTSDIHYSVQISLAYHNKFLGVISLYRSEKETDFSEEELFILDLLKDHLAYRLHLEMLPRNNKLSNPINQKSDFNYYHYMKNYGLTLREAEIVELFFEGKENDEICQQLNISSNTLKKHTANIYRKLGIKKRWEIFNCQK